MFVIISWSKRPTNVVISVCVIALQTKAAVPVMLDLMEALVASLQQIGRLQDRPCRFRVTGSAGNLLYFPEFSYLSIYLTYFSSERHHVIFAPVTNACFMMLGPRLFLAVMRSATPLRQFAELTDNFNNMLLSDFKCSLKTYFYKLSFWS